MAYFSDDEDQINWNMDPVESEEEETGSAAAPERRHSVKLETVSGVDAHYTMSERSKNSIILRHCIEFFAGFEPPMDTARARVKPPSKADMRVEEEQNRGDVVNTQAQTDQLFEEAFAMPRAVVVVVPAIVIIVAVAVMLIIFCE